MAIWDSTVSALNPYVWLKMDSGLPNYGSSGTFFSMDPSAGSGAALVYNATGGKTGAYITYPTTGSEYIEFYPTSGVPLGMSAKTLTTGIWFKKNGIDSNPVQPLVIDSTTDNSAISFIIPANTDPNNAGKLIWNVNSSTGGAGGGIPGNLNASVDNEWHFGAVSINGSTIKYYYDGQNVGESTLTGNYTARKWMIGFNGFNGSFDDFVYFNYVLSDNQILEMYDAAQETAPLKYWDGNAWTTPQEAYLFDGNGYTNAFGHKVWNGSAWLNIAP